MVFLRSILSELFLGNRPGARDMKLSWGLTPFPGAILGLGQNCLTLSRTDTEFRTIDSVLTSVSFWLILKLTLSVVFHSRRFRWVSDRAQQCLQIFLMATAKMVDEGCVLLASNEIEVSGASKFSVVHRIAQITGNYLAKMSEVPELKDLVESVTGLLLRSIGFTVVFSWVS